MMAALLQRQLPSTQDVMLVRSAILRGADIYTPLHIRDDMAKKLDVSKGLPRLGA